MNTQRALWTFLFFTLVGPFVAGLLAAAYTPFAIWGNLAPFSAGDHAPFDMSNLPDSAGLTQVMAQAAIQTFVWAPIAAAIAAFGTIGVLFVRGEVHWALAGAAGVVGFFGAHMIAPFGAGELLSLFGLAAGVVAALLSRFLVRINILPKPE